MKSWEEQYREDNWNGEGYDQAPDHKLPIWCHFVIPAFVGLAVWVSL